MVKKLSGLGYFGAVCGGLVSFDGLIVLLQKHLRAMYIIGSVVILNIGCYL